MIWNDHHHLRESRSWPTSRNMGFSTGPRRTVNKFKFAPHGEASMLIRITEVYTIYIHFFVIVISWSASPSAIIIAIYIMIYMGGFLKWETTPKSPIENLRMFHSKSGPSSDRIPPSGTSFSGPVGPGDRISWDGTWWKTTTYVTYVGPLPSGYLTVCHGKSPWLIGKPSINGPFSMAMLNNQRVNGVCVCTRKLREKTS
jgi:hypothetical protein